MFIASEKDSEVPGALKFVEARSEANGMLAILKAEETQVTTLAHLHQVEHRLLQDIEELSRIAETQHEEGDLRINQLASIAPKFEDEDTPGSNVRDRTTTALFVRSPVTQRERNVQDLPLEADISPRIDNADQTSQVWTRSHFSAHTSSIPWRQFCAARPGQPDEQDAGLLAEEASSQAFQQKLHVLFFQQSDYGRIIAWSCI